MAKKTSSSKKSALENYWEVFHAFCYGDNQSGTYTELIDRVKFFNENQKIVKRIPFSATPDNACLLLFTRRLFLGVPRDIPKTQYDYLFFLVSQMQYFVDYLQDNFRFFHLDSTVDAVIALLKPCIPNRFKELNPDMYEVEKNGMLALGLAGYKDDLYYDTIKKLDVWRHLNVDNEHSFVKLHCMLNNDSVPFFSYDDIKDKSTHDCIQYVFGQNEQKEYGFTWMGKDIAKMRVDIPELGTLIPDKESSKDWDTTQNLYIEGDNLRALKLLLKPYEGKIKMIYIDPPYNTGNDHFVYKDNFRQDLEIFQRLLFSSIPKTNKE